MAKLNEQPPPQPVESIDALKRRFIRQNREIARVNSNQSQRIRNLETEISRLVAENVSLREQAIAAQSEAERWRTSSNLNRETLDLRDRLQRKVDEVGALLGEMGRLPEKAARKVKRKSRLAGVGEKNSATEQEWRHRLSLREAVASEGELNDGRLPAIREDKLFPRRTMENAELAALREEAALQQASESPELGPPPVAHFEVVGESTGLDSARTSEDEVGGDDVMQLPSMLERRRKRRTSALLQNPPSEDTIGAISEAVPEPQDHQSAQTSHQLLKSSAKRKLDMSELDEPISQQSKIENDDFVFQRRQDFANLASSGAKKASRFTRPPGRENAAVLEVAPQSPAKDGANIRRILAPKSTNSPSKRRVHVSHKLSDDPEEKSRNTVVKPARRHNLPPPIDAEKMAQIITDKADEQSILPPKTPAIEDGLFSPLSTEPSVRNQNLPKEAAIMSSVEDVLKGSIGRGSRRARAAVSYAEPSLRDKMRRPGKELVGAVEGLERGKENGAGTSRHSVDRGKSEDIRSNEDQCRRINVNIKEEPGTGADDRWKELPMSKKEEPASPLRDKERKERISNYVENTDERRSAAEGLEKAVDQLSIFDPPTSSPMEPYDVSSTDPHKAPPTARRKPSSHGLGSRRHSVQPSASSIRQAVEALPALPSTASERRSSTVRPAVARPSSAASTRIESMDSMGRELKRANSVSSSLKSKDPSGSEASSNTSTRAERTLNRRRSMMV